MGLGRGNLRLATVERSAHDMSSGHGIRRIVENNCRGMTTTTTMTESRLATRSTAARRSDRKGEAKEKGREGGQFSDGHRKEDTATPEPRAAHYTRFTWHAAETVYSVGKKESQSGDGVNFAEPDQLAAEHSLTSSPTPLRLSFEWVVACRVVGTGGARDCRRRRGN